MSTSIAEIDPNFRPMEMDGVALVFRSASCAPFCLSGFPWYEREKRFCRLPQAALPQANEGVQELAWHTSGGMLRFRTNSSAIALQATLRNGNDMSHMPRTGSGGFDLFEGAGPGKVFRANLKHEHGSREVTGLFRRDLGTTMREWTLYLPLYNGVEELCLGLDPECTVEAPSPFASAKPVLFYGSSITQGGCASRPANAYPAIITRRLDANLINWGFSGNCRAEPVMGELIAGLELGAFVLDYDHNAPSVEHLAATHEALFHTVRQARTESPIVLVSKPDFKGTDPCKRRREIIRATYDHATSAGDRNVYFVDGETLFGEAEQDLCTVDGCHPNDIGFLRMADALTPVVRQALA